MSIKEVLTMIIGAIGSFVSYIFGGWNAGMTTLLIFMGADIVTGLVVAFVFKNSPKTETGGVKSGVGQKGLCRKGAILLVVLIAHRIDLILGANYVKDGTVIAFILNETVSITENIGLMGVKLPKPLTKAIDILNTKIESEEK